MRAVSRALLSDWLNKAAQPKHRAVRTRAESCEIRGMATTRRRTTSKRTKPPTPKKPTARTAARSSGRTRVRLPFGVEIEAEGTQGACLLVGVGFAVWGTARAIRALVADLASTRSTTTSTPAPVALLPAPSRR